MKACSRWWGLLIFLYVLCSLPLHPQAITVSDDAINRTENVILTAQPEAVAPPELMTGGQETPPPPHTAGEPTKKPYGWHYAIYPALAWVPVFGTSVTLPPSPSHPIGPSSGTTDNSFNGAYFGGARLEKGKWSANAIFMWAALSAERKTPLAAVNLDFIFGDALVGREVLPGLYVEGGFRRLALDLHATVESERASRSPGYWDPLVGLTYSRQLGRKWRILIHGDGGGFGVGSDVDVSATGRGEWQFARHFGLAMGYGGLHLSESNTVDGETLTISPTMHGPIFGFGIFF